MSAYRACALQALPLLGFSDAVGKCVREGVGSKAQACVSKMNQLQKTLKQDTGDSFRQLKEHSRFNTSQVSICDSLVVSIILLHWTLMGHAKMCYARCRLMIHINIFFHTIIFDIQKSLDL